jgi:sigma-70-like protein
MNLPEIIRAAIEIGEANGTITFDQLNELIEEEKLEPEDIENLLLALRNEGIHVVERRPLLPKWHVHSAERASRTCCN